MIRICSLLVISSPFFFFSATIAAKGQQWTQPVSAAGHFRIEATSLYHSHSSRYGQRVENGSIVREIEPLGFDFSSPQIGTNLFPALSTLEDRLSGLTDHKNYKVKLGSSVVNLTRNEVRIPVSVSLGVKDYITLGIHVPITRRTTEVSTSFDGSGANVGISPAITNMDQVSTFLNTLEVAESELSQLALTLCNNDQHSTQCTQANKVLIEGQEFRKNLTTSYMGFGVFPVEGSPTGNDLQLRLNTLSGAHSNFGIASYPANVPLATDPITSAHFKSLLTDPSYDVAVSPLESWSSPWEIGDIELFSNFTLLSSSTEQRNEETATRNEIHYLVGAGGLIRLGTGHTDLVNNLIDVGSGDGQNDFEVRMFANLFQPDLWSAWTEVSYGLQRPTSVTKRIAQPFQVFPPMSSIQIVDWTPGAYSQLRLSPSYQITDALTFIADSRYFNKQPDRYTSLKSDCDPLNCLDAQVLQDETQQTLFEIGGGFMFNSKSLTTTRPLNIRFLYRTTVMGSGGMTAKTSSLEFGIQILQAF